MSNVTVGGFIMSCCRIVNEKCTNKKFYLGQGLVRVRFLGFVACSHAPDIRL